MTIKIRNCVFGFRCAQKWNEMKETSRDGVRFCKECEKDVHFVTEEDSLLMAMSENWCIAMLPPKNTEVPAEEYPDLILGKVISYEELYNEPEPNSEYRKRLRGRNIG